MIKMIALNFMNMAHFSPTYYHITERQEGPAGHHQKIPEKQAQLINLKLYFSDELTQVFWK